MQFMGLGLAAFVPAPKVASPRCRGHAQGRRKKKSKVGLLGMILREIFLDPCACGLIKTALPGRRCLTCFYKAPSTKNKTRAAVRGWGVSPQAVPGASRSGPLQRSYDTQDTVCQLREE